MSTFSSYNELLDDESEAATPPEPPQITLQSAQDQAMERFSHLNPFQERKIKRILVAYTKSKEVFYYCHVRLSAFALLSVHATDELLTDPRAWSRSAWY